jgi:hypothetical protein
MEATLEFNPAAYSERSLRLILARAQEWQCPPAEAVGRLLDELAARQRRKDADPEKAA